jgi:raffinose/stachyose/melibiose transport system substrate-binding protein
MLTQCGLAPAAITLNSESLKGLDQRRIDVLDTLDKVAREGGYGYTTWTFWPPKSDTYIYEEIEKVWSGSITAQQYLEGLQKLFDEEVKGGAIPPIPQR